MHPLIAYEKPFRQYPILRALVPLVTGLWSGNQFSHFFPQEMAFCWFLPLVACGVVLALRRRFRRLHLVLALAVCCFGVGWMGVAHSRLSAPWPREALTARGVVVWPAAHTARTERVRVMLTDGFGTGRKVELSLHVPDSTARVRLHPGDGLLFRARLEALRNPGNPSEFDYAGYLRRQGVSGRAYVPPQAWRQLTPAAGLALRQKLPFWSRLQLRALMYQQELAARYFRRLPQDEAALLATLSLGHRSALPTTLRQQFSEVGVSHVLALSGLHLGILVGLLLYVCPRRRRWRAAYYGVVILMIVAFCLLAGLPASLLRAGGMAVFMLLSRVVNRRSRMLQSLFVVTFVLLLVSPLSLLDIGFQLSFLSVLFIGLFMPSLQRRLAHWPRWAKWVAVPLCLSTVAQVGTLPLVLHTFHQFPVYFWLANLLVVPLVTWLLYVAAVFLCIPLPAVQDACVWLLHGLVQALVGSVAWFSSWPGAGLTCHPNSLTTCALMVLAYCLLRSWAAWRLTHRLTLVALLAAGVATAGAVVQARPARIRPQVVFYSGWGGSPVHFMASAVHTYLLNVTPADSSLLRRLSATYWRPCRLHRPQVVGAPVWEGHYLLLRHGVVRFGGDTWVMAGAEWPALPAAGRQVACRVLFVADGFWGQLEPLARSYRPALVVLDAGLPEKRRKQLTGACRRLGWPCHDLATQGALTLACQSEP